MPGKRAMIKGMNVLPRVAAIAFALVAIAPGAADADQAAREAQIARQAQQMQQHFQAPLHAELELARKTCGSLPPEARNKILATGNEAVNTVARQFAERQMTPNGLQGFDPHAIIHAAVAGAIKSHAAAEELAAYEREHAARGARRMRAAKLAMVTKLERSLGLSTAQCTAIEADLEKHWQADWHRDFSENVMINNRRPAPDFADKAIAPHLDERQRAEWKKWCQEAGSSRVGRNGGWSFGGLKLPPDPWWAP